MKITVFAAAVLALAALAGCGPQPMDSAKTPGPDLTFHATVTLTPAAAGKLKAANDHLDVTSHYYGFPAKGASDKANAMGQVELGSDTATATLDAPKVRFTGKEIDHAALGSVADGIVYVWLNTRVLTPQGVQDEILECSHFRGTITKAQSTPVTISCDLATAP